MGPRLGRVEYDEMARKQRAMGEASMGPRLGRVEYIPRAGSKWLSGSGLQWGHA